jgi:heme exporter protein B
VLEAGRAKTEAGAAFVQEDWRARALAYLRAVSAILAKDLSAELRSRELFSAMLVFSLLVVLIFNFALELDRTARENVAAGVLWVTFTFAGTLGLNRSLAMEKDRGSLDGLLLAPVDRSALFFGKMLGNLLFMAAVEAVILPVFTVLFNISLLRPWLFLVIALGTLGFASVGTLLSSMTVHTRAREVMLPILLFPVSVPVVVAAVQASSGVLLAEAGRTMGTLWETAGAWVNLLIVYDVIFLAIALMVFDYVVEE